jgi:hypothetical protein
MADTTFVPHTTPVVSTWAQDINNFFYRTFGAPTTAAQALSAIGGLSTTTAAATYAPIASPTFTGTPSLPTGTTAVTQTIGNNTTKPATTAFVQNTVASYAPLASPVFTGTPFLPTGTTAVTQSNVDSTTKLATTAFVQSVALGSGGLPITQISNIQCSQTTATNTTISGTANLFNNVVYDDLGEMSFPGGLPTFTPINSGTYVGDMVVSSFAGLTQVYFPFVDVRSAGGTLLTTYEYVSSSFGGTSSFTIKLTAGQKMSFRAQVVSGSFAVTTDSVGTSGETIYCTFLNIARIK